MKDLELDCAFEKTAESFHVCMENALLKCKEDVPMKRFTVRTAIIAALILALLAGTAYAIATHFSVKDYISNSSKEFQQSITSIDKNYENKYFSMYVTDAVFDGKSISIAMDIQPKEGASPVYLYPLLSATCGGRELEVDIEGCRGNFFSGFWVPDKEDDLKGQYGVDACIYEDEADGNVQWKLSFMVLKPNWELAYDQTVLHGDKNDPPHDSFVQRYKDAYTQKKILLYDGYSLVEFASIMPAPQGMTTEEYQLQRMGPQLAQSEAFTLAETIECTWNAPVPASYTVKNSGDKLEFDDYTIVMGKVTASFMRVTWEFDSYIKNGAVDFNDTSFEQRVNGRKALGSYSCGPANDNNPAHYTFGGDFYYSGDMPDSITFVPYTTVYREPTKEEAAGMVTPEPTDGKTAPMPFRVYNEAGAFEVKLK